MQIASARLRMNQFGSDIFLHEITPAEAACLIAAHHSNAGAMPLSEVKIIAERKLDHAQELTRLREKYCNLRSTREAKSAVDILYPTPFSKLQETFAEVGVTAEVVKNPAKTVPFALHRPDNRYGQISDQPEGFQTAVVAA